MRHAALMGFLVLGGCANFYPPSRIAELKPGAQYWASYDASRRGAWISTHPDGKVDSCAEPAPDIALNLSTGLKGSVTAGGGEVGNVDASATATALALAGRDNVVLLAREALFRICEQSAMGKLTPDQVSDLITKVFQSTQAIAEAQATKAQNDAQRVQNAFSSVRDLPAADRSRALTEALRPQ